MGKYFAAWGAVLTLLFSSACSTQNVERAPTSSSPIGCYQAYEQLFGMDMDHIDLTELRDLFEFEIHLVQQSEKLNELIGMDGLLENQKKNQLILGMLKRSYPEATDEELTVNFWKQFKRCK